MPDTQRPSLPTSLEDFDLPSSSANGGHHLSPTAEAMTPLLMRLRRPSLLAPKAYFSESRIHSPLASSYTLPLTRSESSNGVLSDESESDREKMWIDSSSNSCSEHPTPPLPKSRAETDSDSSMKNVSRDPSTPPRNGDSSDLPHLPPRPFSRRLSYSVRMPSLVSFITEIHPEDSEVKSEAQFQRLVASCSTIPLQPRTPRAPSDRGRYPEEADNDEAAREDTPSEDGEGDETFAYIPSLSEPIAISKPSTPAHSINGDDMFISESPGGAAMDIDVYGSPSLSSMSVNQWRYTPPPTTSAVRTNKRKLDDRFDPYPTSSKRRAVSPSLSYLRESLPSFANPRTPSSSTRPIPIPIPTIANSSSNSLASSPTISQPIPIPRPMTNISITSSPTMRTPMGLSSPVMRPIHRRRGEEEQREIDGAGEAVGGLTLD
ncbi:hypothetical protein JAAARDRAFT_53573 [Jaapia argillacea MUCL 33604]|uniref:Uncharacterized protein n=1 Tax=Jaapia argillacea MUCL 33604 TaxID=933084 RepID=A0A067Q8G9_9AGAM|nr:hypothetical protein JAAARDRAFT_53573 [Jaapia argillacea MUCL 33604]